MYPPPLSPAKRKKDRGSKRRNRPANNEGRACMLEADTERVLQTKEQQGEKLEEKKTD